MKTFTAILTLTLALTSTGSMAYSLNGDSENGFVLKCKDGFTMRTHMPPNHNTCVAKCEDHGGVAAGYPKPLDKASPLLMRSRPASPDSGSSSSSSSSEATDYNSSRSNTEG